MDLIIDGLWLGCRPRNCDVSKLKKAGIKSIITLDLSPLEDATFSYFKRLFIKAADDPAQNLIVSFNEAISFINENITNGGVFIHCLAGVSRSSTIVIAYLMNKNEISYGKAMYEVSRKRNICPNSGFIAQLQMFEDMGFVVDVTSPIYKQFESKANSFTIVSSRKMNLPQLTTVHTNLGTSVYYACRKCRKVLFHSDSLVHHFYPDVEDETSEKICTDGELFTETLEWTSSVTSEIEGKIYCPRCDSKVGSYNWCGEPCTCHRWVTPAFHFSRKHLDELRTPIVSHLQPPTPSSAIAPTSTIPNGVTTDPS